jgi:seryl-tRNA synthetase
LKEKVGVLEETVKSIGDELAYLRTNTSVADEQIKMIFKMLNEIKGSLDKIAEKIDEIEKKPGRRWDDATRTIVTVALTAVVTFIMSKLLK